MASLAFALQRVKYSRRLPRRRSPLPVWPGSPRENLGIARDSGQIRLLAQRLLESQQALVRCRVLGEFSRQIVSHDADAALSNDFQGCLRNSGTSFTRDPWKSLLGAACASWPGSPAA